jgi:nucleoside-diphosphate-sugar epimerase
MDMNKVLLTGSNGFLGQIFFRYMVKNNKVYTLSRKNADYVVDLEFEIPHFKDDFSYVIHLAGKAHSIPKTDSEKLKFNKVNIGGTKNLLEGLIKSVIPKYFIFISSVSVYGIDFGIKIDENAPLDALDPYGISKIEAEKIVVDWCKQNQVVCTILRLPLLVGPNPPGNLGSMIKAIQKGFYFNITGNKAKKSMVLAEDVAKFLLKVAKIGGIYNLTDGYHPTVTEISNHISHELGKSKPIRVPMLIAKYFAKIGDYLGSKAPLNSKKLKKITKDLTFDDRKARDAFGWNPTPVLECFRINTNVE